MIELHIKVFTDEGQVRCSCDSPRSLCNLQEQDLMDEIKESVLVTLKNRAKKNDAKMVIEEYDK